MSKFLAKQKTTIIGIAVAFLIIVLFSIFSSPVFATIDSTNPNTTIITGEDIPGLSLPLTVYGKATAEENTWGRLIRLTGVNAPNVPPYDIASFFDIGIDDQGNFFINSPVDTKTSHSLIISPDGFVTIPRKR